MDDPSIFAQRLRSARRSRGMTQSALAMRAGCDVREIGRYEHGPVKPREKRLEKIADALNVSPAWLLFGDGDGPSASHAPALDAASSPEAA